ncbi:MAG: preprotein translocase subunit SecG [Alphaproteobacteria bacterium]|nr:preprotein translocase subunit SecG [Alphaproteobacteria bacterium]
MLNVVLAVHLLLAIAIVVLVLLQRSEGGALGIGGGGNLGLMSGRSASNLLTRATAVCAACFFATSIGLTILAGVYTKPKSILEQPLSAPLPNQPAPPTKPAVPTGN